MAVDKTNYTIVVTRPGEAGAELSVAIRQMGWQSLYFPVIAFAPPKDPNQFMAAIDKAGEQDWLIFNSPRAVTASIPMLRNRWPNLPPQVQFAAVGSGTASALHDAGYHVAVVPEQEWSSEGLLATPVFQSPQGKRIMVVRGEGGREYLEKILQERKAIVSSCMAYQRVLPKIDPKPCLQLLKHHHLAAVVAGSVESVANWKMLMGDEVWSELKSVPLLVMSERIKKLAAEMGFQTIWVTRQASQKALLDLILEKKDVLCQMKISK